MPRVPKEWQIALAVFKFFGERVLSIINVLLDCTQNVRCMCVTSFVDPSNRIVVTLFSGSVTIDDVKASCQGIKANPEFHPDFRQFIDLSKASELHLHYQDLNQLAEINDPFSGDAKRALVGPTALSFGIGRMYETILNRPGFQVFRSQPEALTWLGINESAIKEATPALPDTTEEVPDAHAPSDSTPRRRAAQKGSGRGNSS